MMQNLAEMVTPFKNNSQSKKNTQSQVRKTQF